MCVMPCSIHLLAFELQPSAVAANRLLLITPSMPSLASVAETLSVQEQHIQERTYTILAQSADAE
jgi:hypothetical protein